MTPEIDVLVAVAVWLRQRNVLPYQFSIAHGRDIDVGAAKSQLNTALDEEGIPSELRWFVGDGPDITAVSRNEYWQIECKGAGTGKRGTQRNNFDRALASAVSYYTELPPDFAKEGLAAFAVFNGARPVLGLALPETADYISELNAGLRSPYGRFSIFGCCCTIHRLGEFAVSGRMTTIDGYLLLTPSSHWVETDTAALPRR